MPDNRSFFSMFQLSQLDIDRITKTAAEKGEDPQPEIERLVRQRLEMADIFLRSGDNAEYVRRLEALEKKHAPQDWENHTRIMARNGMSYHDQLKALKSMGAEEWLLMRTLESFFGHLIAEGGKEPDARSNIAHAARGLLSNEKINRVFDRVALRNKYPDIEERLELSGSPSVHRGALERNLRSRKSLEPIRFAIPQIDNARPSGISPGEVLSIVAPDGGMKTSLALHILDDYTQRKGTALFLSLDMSPQVIEIRRLMREMGHSDHIVRSHIQENSDEYKAAKERIMETEDNIKIIGGPMNLSQIEKIILASNADCIVIDYVTAIDGYQSELECVKAVTRKVREWRDKWGLCFVLLSQVSRNAKADIQAGGIGSHGLGGGDLERLVDLEIELRRAYLECEEDQLHPSLILTITKNRGGKAGQSYKLYPVFPQITFESHATPVDVIRNTKPVFRRLSGGEWGK